MKTSQRQISLFTEEQSTSSQADSLVSHIHPQESDLGKRTSATSGRICSEQFKRLSQPTSWARTFVDLLIGMGEWSSKKCALTWKIVGTKYNRYYCQLVPSVRHTAEIEFGLLLKTPCAADAYTENLTKKETKFGNSGTLAQEIASGFVENRMKGLLPTPTVFDSTNASATMKSSQVKEGSMHSMTLTRMMDQGMLPTPTRSDFNARGNQPGWDGSDLVSTMHKLTNQTGTTSQLNPRFVAEMMGFPPNWTELPFQSGGKKALKDTAML